MKERKVLDPIATDPITIEFETDVRMRVRVDVRRFLQDARVDGESGAPSQEEFQAFLLNSIERHLQKQGCVRDVRINWLNDELLLRAWYETL